MPEIKPFKAWRYDRGQAGSLDGVFAPPYDVISPEGQKKLYEKNPHNVIRLELGKQEPTDDAKNNRYTRARRFLADWKRNLVLKQDAEPSLYVYLQDYKQEGKTQTRLGFLAAMKIDERAILKHENTLAAPKKDRMALLKEVRTNLSPIFGLFEDKPGNVQKLLRRSLTAKPEVDVTIDGVRHRLYKESRPKIVEAVSRQMRSKPMFIADGHHRFEVSCQYKNWMLSKNGAATDAPWRYVMTYFSDCIHNPFKIFPTHRLVKFPKGMKDALGALGERGKLVKVKNLAAVLNHLSENREDTASKGYDFGIYIPQKGFFILTLNPKLAASVGRNPVDKLDVAVLHRFLIEPCFKIKAIEKSEAIDFTRDAQEACQKVDDGVFDAALFLRPTSLKETIAASKKGLKMPQKSTYFYPKLLSGLTFHSLE